MRAEEDLAAVRRDLRIAERAAGAVVEEVPVLKDGARARSVRSDRDDFVIFPGVVEAHVKDAPGVRAPGRENLVVLLVADAADPPGVDLDRPDVVVAVAVAGEGDRALVGRPGHRVDAPAQVGKLHLAAVAGRPDPDLRRAALVRHVGDPVALR